MVNKKNLVCVVLSLLVVSFLSAQSVTDLSKKEKARRAGVKNKPTAVITNADLAKLKKKPAVEVAEPEKAAAEGETQAAGETSPPSTQEGTVPPQAAQAAPEQKPVEQTLPADQSVMAEKDFKARLNELATKAQDAQEMIDLLTLKMNSLWQEFYNMGDVKARDFTQFQISETYDKLTKAEAEAARATKDLDDFLATAKREGVPTIWIK
ncbi:MAG: hypothetical protein ABSG73_02935 [Candidatus Aminicenantales bacterium]|jgi:hypothetical protein